MFPSQHVSPPRPRGGGRPLPRRRGPGDGGGRRGGGSGRPRPLTRQTLAVPHQVVVATASADPGDQHRGVRPQQLQVGGWPSRQPRARQSGPGTFVRREGRAPQAPSAPGLPSHPLSEGGVAVPTVRESVKSRGHPPCRSPWAVCPQCGRPPACRLCVRTEEPGPGLAPGRRAPPPRAASPPADKAPVPGWEPGVPFPHRNWPEPLAPGGASSLSAFPGPCSSRGPGLPVLGPSCSRGTTAQASGPRGSP